MRELIAIALLVMMSCTVYGQSATNRFPERWLRLAAADLERYDECKIEVQLLKRSNTQYRTDNEKLRTVNSALQERSLLMEQRLAEAGAASTIADTRNTATIQELNRSVKKEKSKGTKKGIGGAIVGFAFGFIITLIVK